MEAVGARLGDGIYDATRGLPVLSREAACQNREFLNRIDTQGCADHVARAAVGIIVDAHSVQPVVVV